MVGETPMRMLETDYLHALLARVSIEFRDHRFFRRNTGLIKLDQRVFRAAIPGQCDLYVIGRGGWHGEVEIKRYGKIKECEGLESKSHRDGECAQSHWRDWCASWGVPWLLLSVERSEVQVPAATIERWVGTLRGWVRLPGCHTTTSGRYPSA
jgi:hypothetical protein